MFRVVSCLTAEHDWRLVVLAGAVCFLASLAAISLLQRARATRDGARARWVATAGIAAGAGIWATHFIAMLAYRPGIAVSYDVGLTALSLIVAVAVTAAGLGFAVGGPRRWQAPGGGAIVGAGIASMHYLGMQALEMPGRVTWSPDLVLASVALGVALSAAALTAAARRGDRWTALLAPALLTLAIVSLHFTAMGAVEIVPDPTRAISPLSLAPGALALAIAGAAVAVLGMSIIGAVADHRIAVSSSQITRIVDQFADARRKLIEQSEELMREQNMKLDAALNNMSHGLSMYDAAGRLMVCNQRYLQMYNLPPAVVKPGCTLRDVLEYRKRAGALDGEVERHHAKIMASAARGETLHTIMELGDGRVLSLKSEPMPGGGWVATHEDITEKHRVEQALAAAHAAGERAEQEARTAHARLRDAFEVVPEGLVLFDARDRYVLWNRRYAELYGGSADLLVEGRRFEDTLRAGLARGQYPDAIGREDDWLAERLARHAQPSGSHEQQLPEGRWVRVEERRTADGGSIGVRIDITELKQREASFRLLFDANPVPMWVWDHETLRYLAVNDAAVEHYGYSREEFLAMSMLDMRPREEWASIRAVAASKDDRPRKEKACRHIKADGSTIDVVIFGRPLAYEGRRASLAAAIDMTERKVAEEELQRTRKFLDTVVENMPVTLFVKGVRDDRFVLLNRAGEEFYGLPREQIIGRTIAEVLGAEQGEMLARDDRELIQSGTRMIATEGVIRTPRNGTRIVARKKILISGDDGAPQYLLGLVEDITERKRAEERVAHLANHDALTDLPNRAAFNGQLSHVLNRAAAAGASFAVLTVDIDRFKEINDVFGHPVGDALIQKVAERLRAAADGAFIARIGGDEFTLITAEIAQPEAVGAFADRLLAAAGGEVEIGEHRLHVALSIGVAIFPNDGTEATALLANADAALHRAKAEGRNAARFFEPEMDTHLRERRALQHELRGAIEGGQILLHYQPQAAIDGEVVGFEALLRWRHPERGLVSPATFIPIAEESGLIIPLGEWVLREACREAASWPKPLSIAVNLSPVQFQHGDLAGAVHAILLETGLSPSRLELEITEGVLIGDFSRAISILRRLKTLGVRIAMDDFGTGYSSLSYLQSFPFDKIKIDKTFISNVERNPQSATIVRAVIGLARGLDMPVVAEGVETDDQLVFLANEACTEVQGYLVGRPAPIETYAEVVGRPGARKRKAAKG